jgi:hypothetical protein
VTHGPELRLDALTREWVAIVGERQDRPNLPEAAGCPFCTRGRVAGGQVRAGRTLGVTSSSKSHWDSHAPPAGE